MDDAYKKAIGSLVHYFEQEKELFGDELIMPRESFDLLKSSLEAIVRKPGSEAGSGASDALESYRRQIENCQLCPLGKSRTNFVFGVGNPKADLLLIGEAPGADEDRLGEPFVGKAGQLLNKILTSIHFKREEVYIANILKCRPPGNRDPMPEEVEKCEPYLHQQISLIQPKVILALGRIAGQTLLKTTRPLTELRGKLHSYQGIPMIVTFHPAALLRNPQWKYPTWDDVRYLRRVYDTICSGGDPATVPFKVAAAP